MNKRIDEYIFDNELTELFDTITLYIIDIIKLQRDIEKQNTQKKQHSTI